MMRSMNSLYPRIGVAILVAFALAVAPRSSAASVLVVSDLGDTGAPGQLRTLINAAAPGDTIVVPPGTIELTGAAGDDMNASGDLDIRKPLTIVGAGAALTAIVIKHTDRLVDVHAPGNLVLSGVTLADGAVDPAIAGGGAIRNRGQLRLVLSVVQNSLSGGGGGIINDSGGTLVVQSSTIRGNAATGISGAGGGILNFGLAEIDESTLSGNKASGTSASNNGGGFENIGTALLTNVTISGNATSGRGGGIFQGAAAGKLRLRNVTISANTARIAAGGIQDMAFAAHAALVNTIVAGNSAGASADCDGTLVSEGYNLLQDTAGCVVTGDPTGNILGVHAHLMPLADNGGPTQTMALRRSSPAIDAGSPAVCPVTDQRGVARPQDGDGDGAVACDIGAFERSGSDR
jgi:hypothetical protein